MIPSSRISACVTREIIPGLLVLLSVIFLLMPGICFSQSVKELEEKLKTVSAEEKPVILNEISAAYLKTDANKSISYAEQALKASRKQDNMDEETNALITLAKAYELLKNQKKTIQYFKEAIKVFDDYNQPASSANLWNEIAESYLYSKKYNEALDANIKALELFKKANDKRGILNMNIEIGDIYFTLQKYESSLPSYRTALKMYEDLKDANGQVVLLNRIGASYIKWGNFDEAYIFLNHALDIAKKNNFNSEVTSILETIEMVKKNLSNWQKSKIEYDLQVQKEQQAKTREQERQIRIKEGQISSLSNQNIKSIEEIENLSGDAQLKELKIKTQKEEILRKQMEAESQLKANEFLKKEKELADLEIERQKLLMWGGVGFSVLGLVLTLLVFIAYRNKKKANDLQKQKNEIIYKQKEQIEQKNILITDSIDYAKNIQDAILPSYEPLSKNFSDFFVFYKPKDIVSGDFFWIKEGVEENCVCVAAADCTGHGVPGAFMSLLGFIMLDDIAKRNAHTTPADVLKEVNTQLMSVLHQNTENLTGKFGMDIALIKYDNRKKEIRYSGAHNPLIIVSSDGQLKEVKADRVSIGTTLDCSFTNHTVQVNKGDMIYLYSDGYQDQIGGDKRKKFLSFHLKELLQQIHTFGAEKQKEELSNKHMEWRNKTDQTDDILLIGLKI